MCKQTGFTMDNKLAISLFKVVSDEYNGLSKRALNFGILMPDCPRDLVDEAIRLYGKDGELYNSLFHKSFKVVSQTSFEALFFQQVFHYMTTYGTDFTSEYIYIPAEAISIPAGYMKNSIRVKNGKIKFVNIQRATPLQVFNRAKSFCSAPLSQKTVDDVAKLINSILLENIYNKNPEISAAKLVDAIKNREVRCKLCKTFKTPPSDPNEFIRYLTYLATGSTLKIKNNETIMRIRTSIKDSPKKDEINAAFSVFIKNHKSLEALAGIFKRDKKYILAFKTRKNAKILNAANRLSKKRKSGDLSCKIIDHITDTDFKIADTVYNTFKFANELTEIPVRKKLALLKTLSYRMTGPEYIEYRIRNGKSWMTEAPNKNVDVLTDRYKAIYSDLALQLNGNFAGKTFIIPDGIDYALPTSEKDFTGDIPNGTTLKLPRQDALIMAVCWDVQCDIDLSILDSAGRKIGWNGALKAADGRKCNTLFSGDMTCLDPATNKASEAFYIEGTGYSGTLKVNLFYRAGMAPQNEPLPFKFVIAKTRKLSSYRLPENYGAAIDPKDVIAQFNMNFMPGQKELTLGTFKCDNEGSCVFTFNSGVGNSANVSRNNAKIETMRRSIAETKTISEPKLTEFIEVCSGEIVTPGTYSCIQAEDDAEKGYRTVVDLTLEKLSKDTFFKLFDFDGKKV